jgi:hypothetical protein
LDPKEKGPRNHENRLKPLFASAKVVPVNLKEAGFGRRK